MGAEGNLRVSITLTERGQGRNLSDHVMAMRFIFIHFHDNWKLFSEHLLCLGPVRRLSRPSWSMHVGPSDPGRIGRAE